MKLRMLMLAAVLSLTACPELGTQERELATEIPDNPTWSQHVKPIMDVYCNECHSVPATQLAPPTLRLDVCETVAGLPGAQSQAIRIVFRTIDQIPSPMPPTSYGIYPSGDEQEILQRWVDQGAMCDNGTPPNNTNNPTDMGTIPVADMGTNPMVDMNMPEDLGMDMGVDMAPDLGPPAATWAQVAAMLEMKCSVCHDGGRGNLVIAAGGDAATIQATVEGQTAQNGDMNDFVTPNNPMASEIYLRVTNPNMAGRMPPNSGNVDQALADALESWILDGAPYN